MFKIKAGVPPHNKIMCGMTTKILNKIAVLQNILTAGALSAVTAAALLSVANAGGIKRTANNMITNARQIFHPAALNQNDAMLLQVVPFTGNVSGNFMSVGQTYTRHFSKRRVRLLRSGGINPNANAPLLGTVLKRGSGCFAHLAFPAFANKLLYGWHVSAFSVIEFFTDSKDRYFRNLFTTFFWY